MNNELSTVNIFKTNQYKAFKIQKGNREVKETAVNALKKKIQEKNLLNYHPILINSNYEVIDGQHRLSVAEQLRYPISYIIMDEVGDIKTTQKINTAGSRWATNDFLKSYCEMGNIHYVRLRDFMIEFPELSLANCLVLFTNDERSGTALFKEGLFTSERYTTAVKIANRLQSFKIVDKSLLLNRGFIRVINQLFNKRIPIDYKRLIENCRCNINTIKSLPRNENLITEVLQDLYNIRLRNKISFKGES
jgi:hypothetical protein